MNLKKISQLLLISFFPFVSIGQTLITINSCDTTISNPGLNLPYGDYVVTIQSNNNNRLCYNVENFNSNNGGPVTIYDGPNTTSPLITTLGDYFNYPGQKYGSQTTGNTISLKFYLLNPGSPEQFKIRIRCIETPVNFPVFQPLKSLYASGNIKSADIDKDGDQDLLVGARVLRNDSYFDTTYQFERKPGVIDGWKDVNMCAADFNNDGYKDIFITGISNLVIPYGGPTALIYYNNGNGTFTANTSNNFTGATRGSCSVVDFNRDGKPDICYTGSTNYFYANPRIFKIYFNNGNGLFTDANAVLPGVAGLVNSSMDWADCDNDGDKDLIINGHDGSHNITKLFTVNGTQFTDMNIPFTGTSRGGMKWVDVNKDGKPDIVNRGVDVPDNTDGITPEIFINNGNNQFSLLPTNLPNLSRGGMDWADYDGDNDMDVVYNGVITPWGNGVSCAVYKNNGNGNFTALNSFINSSSSKVMWYDFNHDGKLDVISDGGFTGGGGLFVKNMGSDSFHVASFHFPANEYDESASIIDDFNNDGLIDVITVGGNMFDVDCDSKQSSSIVFGRGWSISGVPKFTEVANINVVGYTNNYYSWGDFDSDGFPDIMITGADFNGYNLTVYRNNGNYNFSPIFNTDGTPLPIPPGYPSAQLSISYAGMIDVDNDGINELMITPNIIYKNVANQWQLLSYELTNTPGGGGYLDFADFDRDGYMDAVVSGYSGTSVFRNDRNGNLVNISTPLSGYTYATVGPVIERQLKCTDINNDGWPDVVLSNGILENRHGDMVYVNSQLPSAVHFAIADFNADGYDDIITIPRNHQWGSLKTEYSEQGTGFFKEVEHGIVDNTTYTVNNQSAVAFDIDNDGDNDIIFSGPLCNLGPTILVNQGQFSQKRIHLISPNGNDTLISGNNYNIRWIGNLLSSTVKIEVSVDSGRTWILVTSAAPSLSSGGNYNWNVINQNSNHCLIRITDNQSNQIADLSDHTFSIIFHVPNPTLIANAGRDTTICTGSSVQLGETSSTGLNYIWTSDIGGFTSSLANPVVSPTASTQYYLSVTDGNSTAKDTVQIDVVSCFTNLNLVYPNPVIADLTVKLDNDVLLPGTFTLFNTNGLVVLIKSLNNHSTNINLTNFSQGLYFYLIKQNDGQLIKKGKLEILH